MENPGDGNFLGTAADNRISLDDRDRWEGLDSGDESETSHASASGQVQAATRGVFNNNGQQQQNKALSTARASADSENEGYRMFLTQRQGFPTTTDPDRQQPQQPQPSAQAETSSRRPAPAADNEEDRYMEALGSRLVLKDAESRPADEQLNPAPRPPPPAVQEERHFSVRRGGNQLSNLLPPSPPPQQQPPPQQSQLQKNPAAAPSVDRIPALPKELYVGYLKLDSGHMLGPFQWSVDTVETPASLEEGLAADRMKPGGGLFSILVDSQQQATAGGDSNRQRVTTKTGRLDFLDHKAGKTLAGNVRQSSEKLPDSVQRSLLGLADNLANLAASQSEKRSGTRAPQASGGRDDGLTKLLTDALAGNGASLMIACSSPITDVSRSSSEGPSKKPAKSTPRRPTPVDSSVVVNSNPPPPPQQPPAETVSGVASEEQQRELEQMEQLMKSLRKEMELIKSENGALKTRLKEAETAAAAAAATAAGAAPGGNAAENLRPVSKSSYQSLYEMLQEYMQENESLRNENLDLVKYQGEYRKEQDQLAKENRRLATRLDRIQKQQQQMQQQQPPAGVTIPQANKPPLYVVSNPQSRASPSNQRQAKQAADSQQLPDQLQQASDQLMTREGHYLPPIVAAQQPQLAFQTPSTLTAMSPSSIRSQQLQQQQLQQQQQQRVKKQQAVQAYASSSNAATAAADPFYYHMPVGPPSYNNSQPLLQQQQQQRYYQVPPAKQQQQQQPPQQQPPQQQPPQQQQHIYQATESTVYVPKPGEQTYRGRYQQHAAGAVMRDPHRQPETRAHAVQDVNKLNESLKGELRQLDGAIQQHQRVNALQSDIRRNEGRKILRTF